jgi:hypothetical protein
MKKLKSLILALMVTAPLLIPTQSKANGLFGWLEDLFGGKDKKEKKEHPQQEGRGDRDPKNSAPIDGGLVVLMGAGLALGVFIIYKKKKEAETAVI